MSSGKGSDEWAKTKSGLEREGCLLTAVGSGEGLSSFLLNLRNLGAQITHFSVFSVALLLTLI